MKNKLFLIILIQVLLFQIGNSQTAIETLKSIPKYSQQTIFNDSNYEDVSWENFYTRKDIYNKIDYKNVDLGLLNACMLFATNKIRAKYHKNPLSFEPKLRNAAYLHSYYMVKQNFFSHENSRVPKYKTMKDRIEAFDYHGQGIAENIAKGYIDITNPKSYIAIAEETILRFYNSSGHKLNMLNPLYTDCGQACYFYETPQGPYIYFTVTQDYGFIGTK